MWRHKYMEGANLWWIPSSIASRYFLTLRKTICCTVGKFYLSLTLMSSYNNPCWSLLNFSRTNNKWFLLAICLPQNTILIAKIKDFGISYPHAKGFTSLLLGRCPPFLHTLKNLELLSHSSLWKCYPTSTSTTYYPHSKHDLTKGLYFF